MGKIRVDIVFTDESAKEPKMATPGSSGYDLFSTHDFTLAPHVPQLIHTGIKIAIPYGYEGQVRSRSGLALKGVCVANSPGTIDSSYRGEVGVILINHGKEVYDGKAGDRIAQIVYARIDEVIYIERDTLPSSDRGEGGFGHTGK